jgi:putative transposase
MIIFPRLDFAFVNRHQPLLNVFKQWRGLATRYDKLALTYGGAAVLRATT